MKQQTKKAIARKGKALLLTGAMGLATVMAPLTFTACDNGTTTYTPPPPAGHTWTGYACAQLPMPVEHRDDVTVAQMNTFINTLVAAYEDVNWTFLPGEKAIFDSRVDKIEIIPTGNPNYQGRVLTIGLDCSTPIILNYMIDIAEYVVFLQTKENSVKLAKEFDTVKEAVRISMDKTKNQRMV